MGGLSINKGTLTRKWPYSSASLQTRNQQRTYSQRFPAYRPPTYRYPRQSDTKEEEAAYIKIDF